MAKCKIKQKQAKQTVPITYHITSSPQQHDMPQRAVTNGGNVERHYFFFQQHNDIEHNFRVFLCDSFRSGEKNYDPMHLVK